MSEDPRCCGTGTCIINAQGACWCGQKWDGERMCFQQSTDPGLLKGSGDPEAAGDAASALD